MLVAAHNPPVVLHAQTQAMPSQRRQAEVYHAHPPSPATPLPVSVPIALPLPVAVSDPAVVHVPMQARVVQQVPPPLQRTMEEQEVVPVHERLLAVQLAYLASQHHASDYNKFKCGHKGSPNAYVPLSLNAQPYVCDLRAKQARNSDQRAWWVSERDCCDTPEKPVVQEMQGRDMQTEPTMTNGSASCIQQEISAAISSQIPAAHITKTSQSHPINVSMVIPPEILPAIASRLIVRSGPSPVMFHLPENYCLDRVTAIPVPNAHTFSQLTRSEFPVRSPPVRPQVPITWAQHGSVELLQNALSDEFAFPSPRSHFVPSQDGCRMPQLLELPPPPHALPSLPPTPPSPPKGVIRRRPRHGRATSAPPIFSSLKNMQRRNPNFKDQRQYLPRPWSDPEMPTPRLIDTPSVVAPVVSASKSVGTATDELENGLCGDGLDLPPSVLPNPKSQNTPIPASVVAPEDQFLSQRLGNMYLSSCPGKKVRLSGPVKGRGAICRDLRADLMRIRDLRVQCIICCLDDNELDFLGASWSDYSSVANELGLDVVRIPMPEGLAPLSPAWLDTHLIRIIEAYTLRGIHVLAHCRGGVGRAGLVACCWMLKLGLCGWKDPQVCARFCTGHAHMSELMGSESCQVPRSQFQQTENQNQALDSMRTPAKVPRVCRATVRLVERVLAVVRRRRSLKAVETYEQVRFLVEFVEYLDAQARVGVRVCIE